MTSDALIPWSPVIPSGWSVQPAKRLLCRSKELNSENREKNVLSLTLRGVVRNDLGDPEGLVPESYSTYQIFERGDLVFKLIDLENLRTSRVGLVAERGIMSSAYLRFRPQSGTCERFLYWVFFDMYNRRIFNYLGNGVRSTLNAEEVGNLPVPVPPLRQQEAIADYLDTETHRIDALITKKRRMIELLSEARHARLDATFNSFGGSTAALGRFVRSMGQGASPQASSQPAVGDEWGLLKLSAVKAGGFFPIENKALPQDYPVDINLRPMPGDLLVTRSNTPAYVGDACAVTEYNDQVLLCDLIYRLRLDSRLLPAFAAAALRTTTARHHLSSAARGTSQSMVKLRGEDVKATQVPVVDATIQSGVVKALADDDERHARLTTALDAQVGLLAEHRQALITAAVTGEFEVPGVAA